MRIGIFGGTFDPIHIGHLIIAQLALSDLNLTKIVFIPAAIPPHKSDREFSHPQTRLELVRRAIAGNKQFHVSDIELLRAGKSYTVDTLRQMREWPEFNQAELFLIIGADNLVTFPEWHEPEQILARVRLAVYPRREADLAEVAPELMQQAIIFRAPRIEISSSFIRELVRKNRDIKYLVPDSVAEYIYKHNLYK